MVELASGDRPDVLCLQEVPVWALAHLGRWSGLRCFDAATRPPLRPRDLSGWVTRQHQGFFRSALTGQANATLVAPNRAAEALGEQQISERGRERRLVHVTRVDGVVVANLHATNESRPEVPLAELERARSAAEALAGAGEIVVLAGDFNVRPPRWEGWSAPGPGIDHVLVRGAETGPLVVWPPARRMHDGVLLSDHPPVEVVLR
jgi:endonuclease/exonuclease/phosphatase family metal-dependent hydrolase